MTTDEAIAALDAIQPNADSEQFGGSDPEAAHGDSDEILLQLAGPEVEEAYNRVAKRVGGFWYA